MKKLLILLMLIIENIVFGVNTELTGNQEAIVNIEAEILAPLNLEVIQHINFGKVAQGRAKDLGTSGKVKVTGTSNSKIKVFLKGSSEKEYTVTNKCEVLLTKDGIQTTEKNQKMVANLEINKEASSVLLDNGETLIDITGNVTASSSQVPGKYNGKMYIRVEYVDN